MADWDLVLRAGTVVRTDGVERADLGIVDGLVAGLQRDLHGQARTEIDCSELHVFPGVIDSHVHFNEPGRTEWEGFSRGAHAIAAGGGTCFFDMPLNSDPPVLNAAAFNAKRVVAEVNCVTDFALWGGLTPQNLDRLEELRDCGVIGLKAFMSNSGIPEFPRVDEAVLREGMKRAVEFDLLVAVHAEDEAITTRLAQAAKRKDAWAYLDSRPISAECAAIETALELAGETGCALHIVHVSSAEGVRLVTEAKSRGVDVTCETCPHYLVLSENDVIALGAVAKCAPPLRSPQERDDLVRALFAGRLDTLGSDHSPALPSMKTGNDFFAIWGGIASAQHLLPLMLDLWQRFKCDDWPLLGRMLSTNVSKRFWLPTGIGQIAIGSEANLAVVDLAAKDAVEEARLHYRHPMTPYAGRTLHGKVVRTLLRGQTIAQDGQCIGRAPAGRLIKPIYP